MRAIIPVAGFGVRMRPHTHTQPKVLLQVAGKPMLDHIIDDLVAAGVDGVTLIVGYLGDRIEEHVRKTYPNLTLNFVRQDEMLGLGHAIWLTRDIHRGDDRVLIILGDTIVQADFAAMFGLGKSAIAVRAVDDARRFGTVELAEGTRRITNMVEKAEVPPSNLAIVGVYLLGNPALLYEGLDWIMANNVRTKNEFQLTDALVYMLKKGDDMQAFEIKEWLDCGKPETLLDTNRRILEIKYADAHLEYRRQFPSSVFVPPVVLGPGCSVEHSVIGPYVSMASGITVKHSIMADCTVGKGSKLGSVNIHDSMIGEFAEVENATGVLNVGDHSMITGK
jgi:glucose-1-phosphate thymidylyltransferase